MAYTMGNGMKGEISYNKDIIMSIIKIAASEIAGVSSLSQNFGSILKRWFDNNFQEGVYINIKENIITINVYINVYFNYNVSEIAYRVQENIKNAVTSMLDLEVDKINVHVLGVDFKSEENKVN
jgi:uncharacterized alkaline shock family protein YloU